MTVCREVLASVMHQCGTAIVRLIKQYKTVMQANITTIFGRHDLDRARLTAVLEELKEAFTFNTESLKVSENFNSLCIRLGYMLTDTVAMAHVLLKVDGVVRSKMERLSDCNLPVEVRIKHHIANASKELATTDELAVIYKALFFTLRALQDIEYATLLELVGQPAGSGTSMSKCFKPKGDTASNNPILLKIRINIPLYEAWFLRFRNIRNQLKTGRGHWLVSSNGQIRVPLTLQRDSISTEIATIGMVEVIEAIEMSASLFRLMKSLCQSAQAK
jgi:hypothetical protein